VLSNSNRLRGAIAIAACAVAAGGCGGDAAPGVESGPPEDRYAAPAVIEPRNLGPPEAREPAPEPEIFEPSSLEPESRPSR
jgi:hypothetical protein